MSEWYADGTSGHQGEASEAAEPQRRKRIDHTSLLVGLSGYDGLTVAELRAATGWHHGTASATLSNLHRQGRIVRLEMRRGGCGVYSTPMFAGSRPTVPHRSWGRADRITRKRLDVAVSRWWDHARWAGKDRLLDILCDELGVSE